MSTKLPGRNPTAYLGIKETNPPELYFRNRAPLNTDAKPYDQGDIWVDQTNRHAYVLILKEGGVAFWEPCAGTGAAETLTGNAGGAVGPDGADNINVLGSGDILVTGNPGTNTLTLSDSSPIDVETATGNSGGAVPPDAGNNLNIVGTGIVNVVGTPGTNTLTISSTGGIDQQNIIYVGKHGNDGNDGFTIEKAKLTFGAALTAAAAIIPASVVCFDDGVYTENLTFESDVKVFAPNAELVGAHTLVDDCYLEFRKLTIPATLEGFTKADAGTSYIIADYMQLLGGVTTRGFRFITGNVVCHINTIEVQNRAEIIRNSSSGNFSLDFTDIIASTNNIAFQNVSPGEIHVSGERVTDSGGSLVLFRDVIGTGEICANISCIDVATLADINIGAVCNITTSLIKGVAAQTGTSRPQIGGSYIIQDVALDISQTWDITNPVTTNTLFSMTANGERTMPLQPCFAAYQAAPVLGVTGAGAVYVATFNTEEFDQNNDFDSVSTFTAPVAGRYQFNVTISLSNVTAAANNCEIRILNSAGPNYLVGDFNIGNYIDPTGFMRYSASALINLAAANTVTVTVTVTGEAGNTINYNGTITRENIFSGFLVC